MDSDIEALRADAERYRWLLEHADTFLEDDPHPEYYLVVANFVVRRAAFNGSPFLEPVIDAAMKDEANGQ